jgi:pimeloyl-ACP methyl ester carboxylesterase
MGVPLGPSAASPSLSNPGAAGSASNTASVEPAVIPLPTELPAALGHDDAMRLFEYDRSRPFDVVEKSVRSQADVTIHDITYAQAAGSRVQAYLVVPSGAGPFGGVMYLHGAFGGSSDFLDEAVDLAGHGLVSLLINQPELMSNPSTHAEAVTEIVFEMRELRRSLDLLASQPEVDPTRLGFAGFSFGAIRGGTFAGIEGARLKIAVLASTPPSYKLSYMAPFDPIVWAPYVAPAALYVQEGLQDTWFTHDEAESLVAAARTPKKLAWYDAGHLLNTTAGADREAWLEEALGGK